MHASDRPHTSGDPHRPTPVALRVAAALTTAVLGAGGLAGCSTEEVERLGERAGQHVEQARGSVSELEATLNELAADPETRERADAAVAQAREALDEARAALDEAAADRDGAARSLREAQGSLDGAAAAVQEAADTAEGSVAEALETLSQQVENLSARLADARDGSR